MAVRASKQFSSYGDELTPRYHMPTAETVEKKQVNYLRKAFDSFDTDRSGYLDRHELIAALTLLGVRLKDDGGAAVKELDKDGDGKLTFADLDVDGDDKIDYEEFSVLAALLPKREHAIYKGSLKQTMVQLAPDSNSTALENERSEAQKEMDKAVRKAAQRLKQSINLKEYMIGNDSRLLEKFKMLDTSDDGRVDSKELFQAIFKPGDDKAITKRDVWLLQKFADGDNDQTISFPEFRRMMHAVSSA